MVAAAPVLEALADVKADEPRADVPELEVTPEVAVLLDPSEDEEAVRVGETMVVLRTMGEPVPMLGTIATAVVLVGGVGGEVWMDTIAVRLVNDEL